MSRHHLWYALIMVGFLGSLWSCFNIDDVGGSSFIRGYLLGLLNGGMIAGAAGILFDLLASQRGDTDTEE